MSATLSPDRIAVIRRLGAATIYEAQGQRGAMDSGITPLGPGSFIAGPALTVDTRPADRCCIMPSRSHSRVRCWWSMPRGSWRPAGGAT